MRIISARKGFFAALFSLGLLTNTAATANELTTFGSTETAALPRLGQIDARGLPRVLSPTDRDLYAEIFEVQEEGAWDKADSLLLRLSDRRLLGHVLYQRYMHPTAYRSRYEELRSWLSLYADHPGASKVYALALKRKPAGAKAPADPSYKVVVVPSAPSTSYSYRSTKSRSTGEQAQVRAFKANLRKNVLNTRLSASESLLSQKSTRNLLDQVEIDQGYQKVAAAWLYYGDAQRAFALAHPAAMRSGAQAPMTHWIAGLSAWRLEHFDQAAEHFQALAASERASGWNRAAGAYWAARSNLKRGQPQVVSRWLEIGARFPLTFYGQLSRQAMGLNGGLNFRGVDFDPKVLSRLLSNPRGARAAALVQVGRHDLAEKELLAIQGWRDEELLPGLLLFAERAQLPGLSFRLANRVSGYTTTHGVDAVMAAALYPLPPWEPASGFTVDRALIYALMRRESAFDPTATSSLGARGLLQLMPSTASYIAGDRKLKQQGHRDKLYKPAFNLDLGQDYIEHLLDLKVVDSDLIRLAAAYNGGPGNLRKWERHVAGGKGQAEDPLWFIETLPSQETRLFIERVLSNLWIYRQRLGQDTPSLKALAAGQWPSYVKLD